MIDQLLQAQEVAEHNDEQPQFHAEESKYDVDAAYAAVEIPKEKLDVITEEARTPEDGGEVAHANASSEDNEKPNKSEPLALSEEEKKALIEQSKSASGALINLSSVIMKNLDEKVVTGLEERHNSPNIKKMTEDMQTTYRDISNVHTSLEHNDQAETDPESLWDENKTKTMEAVVEAMKKFKQAVSMLRTSLSDPLRNTMTQSQHTQLDRMDDLINSTERQLAVFRNRISVLKRKS